MIDPLEGQVYHIQSEGNENVPRASDSHPDQAGRRDDRDGYIHRALRWGVCDAGREGAAVTGARNGSKSGKV